ncbi:peptide-methionine (S)-S-oxide reductase MsrA [Pedobacter aquatilis]|uniref:peptide-methionine (S)-S-oxide reductase MsrA n=1 Tax=Pedobacter aquatilis TaxID=351343 RepID=UPI0025B5E885|nr:peptide-methionine (S)-S-oxide reductase MsrA [Pedobacter aquatilis]MDN3585846.1 peptide-methionine (S)-S-oxide reductase MsrA [Pedobacter aquatilis]
MQTATFGGGCFWCTEAVFQVLNGVNCVISGYMGGVLKHPTYMEISNGDTGHAEVIQIEFDENVISYNELLLVFFKTHTPTALNRQGDDIGSQYRSVIFYHDTEQQILAEKMIERLTEEKIYKKPIITDVSLAGDFYEAENYHQNYFLKNAGKPYCAFVIQPKLDKLILEFNDMIKSELSN